MSFAELAAVAAIGAGKRPLPRLDLGLPEHDPADPAADAASLLDAAAALAVVRRGAVATRTAAPVVPAPSETLPEPPGDFVTALAGLRAEGPVRSAAHRAELMEEALGWLRQAGCRLPHRLLVGLIDHPNVRVQAAARLVGGERGRWWEQVSQPSEPEPADPWQLGTESQRLAYLHQVRADDPAAGRELVAAEWSNSPATLRVAFLRTLTESLDPGDEGFLESALDDRSRLVREAASEALGRLPGSAYRSRMGARLPGVLHIDLDRRQVQVVLPQPDPAAQRDGFSAQNPDVALLWVLQAVPPPDYPRWLGVKTRDWLGIKGAELIHELLAEAAVQWHDAQLAADLVEVGYRDRALLPVARGEALIRLVTDLNRRYLGPALENQPRPWPDDLAETVLAVLRRPVVQRDPLPADLTTPLALGVRADAAGAWAWRIRELVDTNSELPTQTRNQILQAATMLTVRDTLWTSLHRGPG